MQQLAERFLTQDEQEEVTRTVQRLEQQTTGEIVPMIVSASHDYPEAVLSGAVILTAPLALAAALVSETLYLWDGESLWLFLGYFSLLFPLIRLLLRRLPFLLRCFLRKDRVAAEVEKAAFTHFFAAGLHRTREATGILIYISVLERRVWILGDRGINEKLAPQTWKEAVDRLATGIRLKRQAVALCATIEEIGALLHTHFPPKDDDRNELSDLIIERDSDRRPLLLIR